MALDIGTLVAKVKVDDDDFDKKTKGWSTRGAAIGSAFGNVAANAISSAASAVQGFIGDAVEASDATDKFKQTLAFAGIDNSTIKALTKSTRAYADETVYGLSDVMSITAQLAANGVKDYDSLAMSLGNLNAASSGNEETYGRLGSVLTQTAGAGKLTTENWNQLAEAIPGASGVLQEAMLKAGAYTGNFREAMAKGEITAEEFNAAIMELGNDPVAVEAAKSTKTFEGALGGLQATVVGVIADLLNKFKPTITDIINALSGAVEWVVANKDWLTPFAIGLGVVAAAVGVWSAAQWILNAAMTANPVGLIIVGIGLLIGAIILLVQNWDTVVAFITDIWGGFVDWIVSVIDGFVAAWNMYWGLVRAGITAVWNAIVGWVTGVVSGFIAWIVGAWNSYLSFWRNLWTGVSTTVSTIWNNIISFIGSMPGKILGIFQGAASWLYNIGRDIINGLWEGLKSIWAGVSSWFENTFGGIIDTIAGIFGIASPSRVMRYQIAGNIGKGMIQGLQDYEDPIDQEFRDMLSVPSDTGFNSGRSGDTGATTSTSRNVTYIAAEGQSLSAEEALFAALGSPRVKD